MNTLNGNRQRVVLKAAMVMSLLLGLNAMAATKDTSLDQKMRDCYAKHSQLMGKPAMKNLYDCYRVHSYLMNR